ncbi:hypothetical protein ACI7RC_05175 [Brevibacillus sp. B_LB10_24]|uniref:YncE family protein n=1 Tax=Brevibacillus sp. B_LB10_24 TaxID=3380645 RepID=UPI0038BC8FAC
MSLSLLVLIGGCSQQAAVLPQPGGGQTFQPASLLLVDDSGEQLQASPIDPVTLQNLPGDTALRLGHHYNYAASRDGKQLAFAVWPTGEAEEDGELHLINTTTWQETKADGISLKEANQLCFSEDGSQLYWLDPVSRSYPPVFQLFRYDLATKQASAIVDFPESFIPTQIRLMPGGREMTVYGEWDNRQVQPFKAPDLFSVDLKTNRVRAQLTLDGIQAGNIQEGSDSIFHSLSPGLAWDLQRKKLYIAHAGEEKLTVVNLDTFGIEKQAEIRPARSVFGKLFGWLIPAAQAKLVEGTDMRAALSADGGFLYVTGVRRELHNQENGVVQMSETPLGLRVIATSDATEVQRLAVPADDVHLTPDGKYLLLTGATRQQELGRPYQEPSGSGLYVYDAERVKQLALLEPDSVVYVAGFSPDSRHVYTTQRTEADKEQWNVVDLKAAQVVARRESSRWFMDVVPLVR